jgi:hypothetical protein
MRMHAGKMRFQIPDKWSDESRYEFRSPDGLLSIEVLREVSEEPFDLDAVARGKITIFATGAEESKSSPTQKGKLGKFEMRSADVFIAEGAGGKTAMRLIFAQLDPKSLVSIYATSKDGRMSELAKVVDEMTQSFAIEEDKGLRP